MYPIFNVFDREIGIYAVCAIVGLLVCGCVGSIFGRKEGIEVEEFILSILSVCGGIMVGGHLLYGAINAADLADEIIRAASVQDIINSINICFGGSVFYGGFIGGAAALYIYVKFGNKNRKEIFFDFYGLLTPLFHFFGRIGCFFAGCCFGVQWKYGLTVYNNAIVPQVCGVPRFPVALLEAVCNAGIFALLLWLFLKERAKGHILYVYMLVYPIVRFGTEFLRGDEYRGFFLGLSTSQWISIIIFLIAFIKFFGEKYYKTIEKNRLN